METYYQTASEGINSIIQIINNVFSYNIICWSIFLHLKISAERQNNYYFGKKGVSIISNFNDNHYSNLHQRGIDDWLTRIGCITTCNYVKYAIVTWRSKKKITLIRKSCNSRQWSFLILSLIGSLLGKEAMPTSNLNSYGNDNIVPIQLLNGLCLDLRPWRLCKSQRMVLIKQKLGQK